MEEYSKEDYIPDIRICLPPSTCQNHSHDVTMPYNSSNANTCIECVNFDSKINVPDRNTMGQRFYDLGGACYRVESHYGIKVKCPYSCCIKDTSVVLCGSFTCIKAMVEAVKEKAVQKMESNCKNFVKVKLPKVDRFQVGMKYYELKCDCKAWREHYGLTGGVNCVGKQCGSDSCTSLVTDIINQERGY